MRLADLSPAAAESLKVGLDSYLSGLGRQRLIEAGVNLDNLQARGVLAKARLDLATLPALWTASGAALDALFGYLYVCLFDGDRSIGFATLARADDGAYALEHVSLTSSTLLVDGLTAIQQQPDSAALEIRVLHVLPLALHALVLVRGDAIDSYFVLAPRYQQGAAAVTPADFRAFAESLEANRDRAYPPQHA